MCFDMDATSIELFARKTVLIKKKKERKQKKNVPPCIPKTGDFSCSSEERLWERGGGEGGR